MKTMTSVLFSTRYLRPLSTDSTTWRLAFSGIVKNCPVSGSRLIPKRSKGNVLKR